eukprot:6471625-Amphidinium_carterae.2
MAQLSRRTLVRYRSDLKVTRRKGATPLAQKKAPKNAPNNTRSQHTQLSVRIHRLASPPLRIGSSKLQWQPRCIGQIPVATIASLGKEGSRAT